MAGINPVFRLLIRTHVAKVGKDSEDWNYKKREKLEPIRSRRPFCFDKITAQHFAQGLPERIRGRIINHL
jgi:hypothetical protein